VKYLEIFSRILVVAGGGERGAEADLVSPLFHSVQLARGLGESKKIRSIAVCPGSGGSVIGKIKADLYLTGE